MLYNLICFVSFSFSYNGYSYGKASFTAALLEPTKPEMNGASCIVVSCLISWEVYSYWRVDLDFKSCSAAACQVDFYLLSCTEERWQYIIEAVVYSFRHLYLGCAFSQMCQYASFSPLGVALMCYLMLVSSIINCAQLYWKQNWLSCAASEVEDVRDGFLTCLVSWYCIYQFLNHWGSE